MISKLLKIVWVLVIALTLLLIAFPVLLMMALPAFSIEHESIVPYTDPSHVQPETNTGGDGLGWVVAGFVGLLWLISAAVNKILRTFRNLRRIFFRRW